MSPPRYTSVTQAISELVIARTDGYGSAATMDPYRLFRYAARAMSPTQHGDREDSLPVSQAVRLADVERALAAALKNIVAPEAPRIVVAVALARLSGWTAGRTAFRFRLTEKRVQQIARIARTRLARELVACGLLEDE